MKEVLPHWTLCQYEKTFSKSTLKKSFITLTIGADSTSWGGYRLVRSVFKTTHLILLLLLATLEQGFTLMNPSCWSPWQSA
jgi:hypothetical protein